MCLFVHKDPLHGIVYILLQEISQSCRQFPVKSFKKKYDIQGPAFCSGIDIYFRPNDIP